MLRNVWSVFERQDVPVGVPGSELLGASNADIFTQSLSLAFKNRYHVRLSLVIHFNLLFLILLNRALR